jgi:hypothetical protein
MTELGKTCIRQISRFCCNKSLQNPDCDFFEEHPENTDVVFKKCKHEKDNHCKSEEAIKSYLYAVSQGYPYK